MAFDLNNGSTNNTGNNTNVRTKADGFINIYLPTKAGGKKKVGFLSLTDTNSDQKQLREWLQADPGNISIFASKLVIEYNSAEKKEEHQYDLG